MPIKVQLHFNSNAELNTSDGASTPDNTVITYLNNATLGLYQCGTGQNVGLTAAPCDWRAAIPLKLQLTWQTTLLTDLIFAKLAADSSTATQYITVGYDKAFDGSSLDSFIGEVLVLV